MEDEHADGLTEALRQLALTRASLPHIARGRYNDEHLLGLISRVEQALRNAEWATTNLVNYLKGPEHDQ